MKLTQSTNNQMYSLRTLTLSATLSACGGDGDSDAPETGAVIQ